MNPIVMDTTLPALFVPHGAPTFALAPGAAGAAMAAAARALPRPRAIVVVSAHWEVDVPTLGVAEELETIHDFWGFPAPLYDLRYPARGSLAAAEEVRQALRRGGYQARLDTGRGLDHGAWIPLRQMYPAGDIPVVPLSLLHGQGPAAHFALGRALAPLLAKGILVLASGNLTHNLQDYGIARLNGTGSPAYVGRFADWMWQRLAAGDSAAVIDYRQLAPEAARAHPGEDHLLPLHVALGAAGPAWTAERLYDGIDNLVLAMDAYAFHPQELQ
mgnify:CR=1 FL=1